MPRTASIVEKVVRKAICQLISQMINFVAETK
jgi:hypothetical protein